MSAAVGDTRKYLRLNPDADRLEMVNYVACRASRFSDLMPWLACQSRLWIGLFAR